MRIALKRGNCNFNRVLQDKWDSAETATGVHDCGYGYRYRYARATGTDTGVRAGVDRDPVFVHLCQVDV